MSKLFRRIAGFFSSRISVGLDKAGNRYFTRNEEIDGVYTTGIVNDIDILNLGEGCRLKEKRWVVFKGEDDPTSIPVEWICWLNGQRKKPPTPEEMIELEARRELIKQNVALLKKEEEERKEREGSSKKGKATGPDLKSFIRQFTKDSEGEKGEEEESVGMKDFRNSKKKEMERPKFEQESSEPSGSGQTYRPGTWQPPT